MFSPLAAWRACPGRYAASGEFRNLQSDVASLLLSVARGATIPSFNKPRPIDAPALSHRVGVSGVGLGRPLLGFLELPRLRGVVEAQAGVPFSRIQDPGFSIQS